MSRRALRALLHLEWLRLRRQPVVLGLLLFTPVSFCTLLLVSGTHAVEALLPDTDEPEEAPKPLKVAGPPELAERLLPEDALEWVEGDLDDAGVRAELVWEEDGGALIRHRSSAKGRKARDRLRRALRRWRDADQEAAWAAAGLPISPDALLAVEVVDDADPEAAGVALVARGLPSILVFICLLNGLYMALDAFSGERERGTLETLLVSGPPRRLVLLAKLLVVWGVVAGSALLALLVIGIGGPLTELGGVSGVLRPGALLLTLPLTAFIAALLALCAAWLPDYRSTQIASLPLMLGLQVPASLSLLPQVELSPLLAIAPIAGPCLALRDGLLGQLSFATLLGVSAATAGWCLALVSLGGRLVAREEVVFGGGVAGRRARGQLLPEALGVFAVMLVALWLLAAPAQALSPTWGMVFTQVVILGGGAAGALLWLGLPWRSTIAWRPPAWRDLGWATLIGLSAWGVSLSVASLQTWILPPSRLVSEALSDTIMSAPSLPVALLCFAVLPAVFEELLFRGVLQGMLQRALGPLGRCLFVAALFGMFHLDLSRVAPTAALGLILCVTRWRSGALLPVMLIHFFNNALMILVSSHLEGSETPPAWLLALAGVACLFGLSRVGRGPLR